MNLVEWTVTVGVLLAILGAVGIVLDSVHAGGDRRFVAYLVGLLLVLAGIGLALSVTL